jgi:His/Glu/Gln/Arg/opine family amino acid ABC transporter permease subunit
MADTVRTGEAGLGAVAPKTGPPDVRGTSSPWARSVFAAGVAALVLVIGGVALVQVAYALQGGRITPECRAVGLVPFKPATETSPAEGIEGAEGVCNIVEALRATPTTVFLWVGVVVGVVAIAAGFGTYKRMDSRRRREHCITGAVLGIQAVVVGAFLLWFREGRVDRFASQFLNFERLEGYWLGFIRAARNTLFLAFGGEIGGIVVGLILAMLVISSRRAVRAPARAYINFFRGTPLLWQLSFFYFGIVLGLNLPLGVFEAAILVFILNTGAYAAEVFRAGIQSIERGQIEAARSLGMTYLQAMRFAIVPQAVRRVIPPLMNEFVILIKDTALVIVLGLARNELEIFNYAREGYSSTANATFFVVAAIAYLTVTLPLIRLVNIAERRLRGGLLGLNVGQQGL